MRHCWPVLACAFAFCMPSLTLHAQTAPVDLSTTGPSDRAVLLPPQTFDDSAKRPNTTREKYGQWSIAGGVYFLQPVFATNSAFVVNSNAGNSMRQVDFGYGLD